MGITPFSQPGSTGHFRRNKANKRFKRAWLIKSLLNIPANDTLSTCFLAEGLGTRHTKKRTIPITKARNLPAVSLAEEENTKGEWLYRKPCPFSCLRDCSWVSGFPAVGRWHGQTVIRRRRMFVREQREEKLAPPRTSFACPCHRTMSYGER